MAHLVRRVCVGFGAGLLAACAASGSLSVGSDGAASASRVDEVFAAYDVAGSPGAVVTVIQEGETVFANAYGLADLRTQRPLTGSTPVRLGSLTKQFTAMAIMMLEEQGTLAYDDPASTWVPEIGRFGVITVRHLLTHTSGLPDYYDRLDGTDQALAASDGAPLLTGADAVTAYSDGGEVQFPIGSQYGYSNPGYEVLGLIVERASGQRYSDFMDQRIFGPLGMSNAAVRDTPNRVVEERAVGYRPTGGGSGWMEDDDHVLNWILGAGGIYASVEDMARWDRGLAQHTLVSQATLAAAFTPVTLADGSSHPYGFGWGLSDRLGRPAVHHSGSWVGFRTAMARFTNERLTVIVLSNASAPAGELLDQVARIFLQVAE